MFTNGLYIRQSMAVNIFSSWLDLVILYGNHFPHTVDQDVKKFLILKFFLSMEKSATTVVASLFSCCVNSVSQPQGDILIAELTHYIMRNEPRGISGYQGIIFADPHATGFIIDDPTTD